MPGLGRLIGFARRSIRVRLLLLALLPLGLVLPLSIALLADRGGAYLDRLLVSKVGSDLAVAHGYFERVTEGVGNSIAGLADSTRLVGALGRGEKRRDAAMAAILREAQQTHRLDFLYFLDLERSRREAQALPAIGEALQGRAQTETEVFSAAQLFAISPSLAERARIPLRATAKAHRDDSEVEIRGLIVHAAAPVRDQGGRIVGVLSGGILLNKNLDFIDRLNDIVYPQGALPFGGAGTATLFLGNVRIATNVRLFGEARAIGTRVSAEVQDAVLGQGRAWLDRAFVVSDWYVSAYEPLLDSRGRRVGMLYVGFLEGPYLQARHQAFIAIAGLFVLAMLGAGFFAVLWARSIFRPIERMHATILAVERGEHEARVGPLASRDELAVVAAHFDRMLDRLQEQAASLQRRGESLDVKVAERTQALEQAVGNLKAAQSQLIMNEKMAAIGQLTAGVAHEINNPIAVIQGNLDVLRDLLGPQADPVAPEIKLIQEQVHRIRLIVAKLLQFARPQDYVGYLEPVRPASLIQDSLILVRHLLRKGDVAVEQQIDSTRQVTCNRNELQQVMVNLLVNAIQAMPDGGVLRIVVEDWDELEMPLGVRLIVADSGHGVSEADREQLFQPFFTARKADGNGLGLWVSKSLVERYGGRIEIESAPGQGARFIVFLRLEPPGS